MFAKFSKVKHIVKFIKYQLHRKLIFFSIASPNKPTYIDFFTPFNFPRSDYETYY